MGNKKIENLCKKYKIEEDIIDFKALWDSGISDEENLDILEEKLKVIGTKEITKKEVKAEQKDIERVDLDNLKKEAEYSKKEFDKAIESIIKDENAGLDKYFNPLVSYVKAIAQSEGYLNSLFVVSTGGLGKTTNVLKTLKELNLEYIYISNYTTIVELVNFLYENRNKIIVFDDFETIWKLGVKGINILKGALWGVGKENKRLVTYLTTDKRLKTPPQFEFKGKMFFLLNKKPDERDDLIKALMTRSILYEMNFTYRETIEILAEFIKLDYKTLKLEERQNIFNYLKENTDETTEINIRTLIKMYDLYLINKTLWKELAKPFLKRDERLFLIKKFIEESNTMPEAVKRWTEKTGKSRATFYRDMEKIK